MLLIAGGDADPQLRRMIERATARDLPVQTILHREGGQLLLEWDLETGALNAGGKAISPTGAFVRQDVFRFLQSNKQIDRDDARSWKVIWVAGAKDDAPFFGRRCRDGTGDGTSCL